MVKEQLLQYLNNATITACSNSSINGYILYLEWNDMEGDTSPKGRGLGDTSPEGRVSPLGINNVVIKIGTTFIPVSYTHLTLPTTPYV